MAVVIFALVTGEVESAAKGLLIEVVRAIEILGERSLPHPAPQSVNPRGSSISAIHREAYMDNIAMKAGDWKCPEYDPFYFSKLVI